MKDSRQNFGSRNRVGKFGALALASIAAIGMSLIVVPAGPVQAGSKVIVKGTVGGTVGPYGYGQFGYGHGRGNKGYNRGYAFGNRYGHSTYHTRGYNRQYNHIRDYGRFNNSGRINSGVFFGIGTSHVTSSRHRSRGYGYGYGYGSGYGHAKGGGTTILFRDSSFNNGRGFRNTFKSNRPVIVTGGVRDPYDHGVVTEVIGPRRVKQVVVTDPVVVYRPAAKIPAMLDGWALLEAGRFDRAQGAFGEIASAEPKKADPKVGYGVAAALAGRHALAATALRRADQVDPTVWSRIDLPPNTADRVRGILRFKTVQQNGSLVASLEKLVGTGETDEMVY